MRRKREQDNEERNGGEEGVEGVEGEAAGGVFVADSDDGVAYCAELGFGEDGARGGVRGSVGVGDDGDDGVSGDDLGGAEILDGVDVFRACDFCRASPA